MFQTFCTKIMGIFPTWNCVNSVFNLFKFKILFLRNPLVTAQILGLMFICWEYKNIYIQRIGMASCWIYMYFFFFQVSCGKLLYCQIFYGTVTLSQITQQHACMCMQSRRRSHGYNIYLTHKQYWTKSFHSWQFEQKKKLFFQTITFLQLV